MFFALFDDRMQERARILGLSVHFAHSAPESRFPFFRLVDVAMLNGARTPVLPVVDWRVALISIVALINANRNPGFSPCWPEDGESESPFRSPTSWS